MIAVDTNVLVYADRAELPMHKAALGELRELAQANEAWALPVFVIGEFVRVVSHPRLFDPPTPAVEAMAAVESLLQSPSVRILNPGERFFAIFRDLVRQSRSAGNHVFDAQIAAVCLEHGARTILSEDRDFERFSEISVRTLPRR